MKLSIPQNFWTDALYDIDESDLPWVRLTILWAYTSPQTSMAGTFNCSKKTFTHQTGLEAKWLESTLKRWPEMFVQDGRHTWIRPFIGHMFGRGPRMAKNNCVKALPAIYHSEMTPLLRSELLKEYPELKPLIRASYGDDPVKIDPSPSTGLNEGSASPPEALGLLGLETTQSPEGKDVMDDSKKDERKGSGSPYEGQKQSKAKQSKDLIGGDGGGAEGRLAHLPTLSQAIEFGRAIECPEHVTNDWWLGKDEKGWEGIRNWQSSLRRKLQWHLRDMAEKGRAGGRRMPNPFGTTPQQDELEEVHARLTYETDPAVIAELKNRRAQLGG